MSLDSMNPEVSVKPLQERNVSVPALLQEADAVRVSLESILLGELPEDEPFHFRLPQKTLSLLGRLAAERVRELEARLAHTQEGK